VLKKDSFGSTCELTESFLKKIGNCGIIKNAVELAEAKESLEMKKKMG